MDGMLSQDEINALLSGMDLTNNISNSTDITSDMNQDDTVDESLLSDMEKDAIGEVANISLGSSTTTLYSLVNRKVKITTPVVTLANWNTVLKDYEKSCVFIQIKYTKGLEGSNILVLKERDVKVIADLMMGGDGTNTDVELGELHLSAISEAMNQMMGSAATSLSTMLGIIIDISPPDASLVNLTSYRNGSDIAPFLGGTFVKIAFSMQIDDLVDSSIMQLYPIDFAKDLVDTFMTNQSKDSSASAEAKNTKKSAAPDSAGSQSSQYDVNAQMGMNPQMGMDPQMGMNSQMGMNPMYGMGMNSQGAMAQMYMPPQMNLQQQNVNIHPAQFQNFSNDLAQMAGQENIGLIRDVPLEVTVELGRTTKSIAEILDFAPGTIIELNRIAGEPIDVLVNGKFVAKGEVVVIEENFGIRVTEIIKDK